MRSILVAGFVIISAFAFAQQPVETGTGTASQLQQPSLVQPQNGAPILQPPSLGQQPGDFSRTHKQRVLPNGSLIPSQQEAGAAHDIISLLEQSKNRPAMIYTAARPYDCVILSVVQNQQFVKVKGSHFAEGIIRIKDIEAVFVQSGVPTPSVNSSP